MTQEMTWQSAESAPADIHYCIAVLNGRLTCEWYFATRHGGQWIDLNSAEVIQPNLWLAIPAPPEYVQ